MFKVVLMPRIVRAVAVGYPYHLTQRGNDRQTVFESDKDYLYYMEYLNVYSKTYSLVAENTQQNTKTGHLCGNDGFMLRLE